MEAELIPAVEAAALLGISVPTLHRWVDSGKLTAAAKAPGLRGARLFARSDVEAVATARREAVALP